MRSNPLPLTLVVTLALASSTVAGALSCAAWLASTQQLRLAVAVIAFALLVVPGELVAGAVLGWRLQQGRPWSSVARWLVLWVTGSVGVVGGALLAGPAPEHMIWLALAAAVLGGLVSAMQKGPLALLRTTLPWAVGAGPLWWAAGCAAPATPSEAAAQGTAVVASILLPVVAARVV
jgi:hypothetical protein